VRGAGREQPAQHERGPGTWVAPSAPAPQFQNETPPGSAACTGFPGSTKRAGDPNSDR
jgi:hypothetical protein